MNNFIQHIAKGENEFIEFKTSFNKETIESLVAFANAKAFKEIGLIEVMVMELKEF